MKNKIFWLGILVMVLVFGMTLVGCGDDDSTGKGGKTPEEMTEQERWENKWIDTSTSVTITDSFADDVCTITVGGTPAVERWQGNVGYLYTVKKDKHYTYKIEAWTQSGTRTINVQYFGGGDNTVGGPPYLGQPINLSTTKKMFTFVGEDVPWGGAIPLEIQCADQLGTFYVKVISISEGGEFSDNANVNGVQIRSVSPTTGLIDGVETTFTIVADYLFYGFEHCRLCVQFGYVDDDFWMIPWSGEEFISAEGKGTHTFTVEVIVNETFTYDTPSGDFYVRCELGCYNGENDYYDSDVTGFWTTPIKLPFSPHQ